MDGLESDNWLGDLDFQSSVLWHFGSPFHHLAVDLVQHGNFYTDPALLNVNGAVNALPDFVWVIPRMLSKFRIFGVSSVKNHFS